MSNMVIKNKVTFEEQDEYGRKIIAEKLLDVVRSNGGGYCLSIDGAWGTGKTSFVEKTISFFNDNGVKSVKVDAFQEDYIDDPASSILAELSSIIKDDDAKREYFAMCAKGLVPFAKGLAKAGVRIGTGGIVSIEDEDIAVVMREMEKAGIETIEKSLERFVEIQANKKQAIKTLHSAISRAKEFSGSDDPVVIFIDELDRCRPSYTIEVIEKVKHVFECKDAVFVLSLNSTQVCESLRKVYGNNIDADEYLDKFIRATVLLPNRDDSVSGRFDGLASYKHCFNVFGDFIESEDGFDSLVKVNISTLSGVKGLSFRQIEKLIDQYSLCKSSIMRDLGEMDGSEVEINSCLVTIALFFKEESRSSYERVRKLQSIENHNISVIVGDNLSMLSSMLNEDRSMLRRLRYLLSVGKALDGQRLNISIKNSSPVDIVDEVIKNPVERKHINKIFVKICESISIFN